MSLKKSGYSTSHKIWSHQKDWCGYSPHDYNYQKQQLTYSKNTEIFEAIAQFINISVLRMSQNCATQSILWLFALSLVF